MADENIKQFIKEENKKTRQHFDEKVRYFDDKFQEVKDYVDTSAEKTRNHFDVVAEGLTHKIDLVAEGVMSNGEKIDRMQTDLTQVKDRTEVLEVKMVSMEINIETMKNDVSVIKNDLKQKVDRDEFAALEKRVGLLETRVNITPA